VGRAATGVDNDKIEIDEDVDHERREWRAERFGWVVMAGLLIAAVAGLLGDGPLSHASAGADGAPLRLDYDRVVRSEATTALTLRIAPAAIAGGQVRVWLDRAYLARVEPGAIQPPPLAVEVGPERMTYTFAVAADARPAEITFQHQLRSAGSLEARIGLAGDGDGLPFHQLVLP
jgi:hypothetical protein